MYSKFQSAGAKYILASTITLFGNNSSDSKTLVLNTINKHFPHLKEKYQTLFGNEQTQLPAYYHRAFTVHITKLAGRYGIKTSIV